MAKARTEELSGNKGEWSEVYVILKLLADGKLYSAGERLEKIDNVFFRILKIIREESLDSQKIEFILNGNIKIKNGDGLELLQIPTSVFIENSLEFFNAIKEKKGRSFQVPEFKEFLKSIHITSLKAKSAEKADITLIVEDVMTNNDLKLSFSIKSLIGQKPTLLNPGVGTNFIYKVTHPDNTIINLDDFNKSTYSKSSIKGNSKISKRIKELNNLGFSIDFVKIQSEIFQLNLELIDSDLPKILSQLLLYRYIHNTNNIEELLNLLNINNPLKYNTAMNHPFYTYKLKGLLYDYALGMTPEKVWNGDYASTAGIIIVKDDGEALCYRVYHKDIFQRYLLKNTMLEQPSTGEDENNPGYCRTGNEGNNQTSTGKKYCFGWVYEDQNEYYLKLNLQIRFI
ncbi:MAG TPA: HpaII family restriction endonuclease [Flavipsychrobacter sp.]|nr:HpaII family restriction endonuclease [Flavipsychrobacter sp.]